MADDMKDMGAVGLPGVKGTGVIADGAEVAIAGRYCVVSSICPRMLTLEMNRLSEAAGWLPRGSPVHDSIRFHQWMVAPSRRRATP